MTMDNIWLWKFQVGEEAVWTILLCGRKQEFTPETAESWMGPI